MDAKMPAADRLQVLSKKLISLGPILAEIAESDTDFYFEHVSSSLVLKPSEISALRSTVDHIESSDVDVGSRLLAETLALLLKASDDVGDFKTAAEIDPELGAKIEESLELDNLVAESLAADFGELIGKAVKSGDRTTAVRLGEIRLALRQQMAQIRRVLAGMDDPDEATVQADEQAAEPISEQEIHPDDEEQPDEQFEKSRRRHAKRRRVRHREMRTRQQMKRLRILLGLLGFAVVIGAIAFVVQLVPALNPPETKILSLEDFSEIPLVVSVDARPPSLFVRINGTQWTHLKRGRRIAVMNEVGYIAAAADYNGIKFRDETDLLLGEWIRGVGTYEFSPE